MLYLLMSSEISSGVDYVYGSAARYRTTGGGAFYATWPKIDDKLVTTCSDEDDFSTRMC